MKIPPEAKIDRELRYGHMERHGYAKWITDGYEGWDGERVDKSHWDYDWDGYEKYLRSLDLSEREVNHLTKAYDREVDLGRVEKMEKAIGRTLWLGSDKMP